MWSHCKKPLLYLKNCSKSPGFLQSYAFSDTTFKKSKIAPLQERKMIDRCRLWVKGGDGGNGCSSFRRSRSDRRGKADGANGGRGGDVILESSRELWDFSSILHHVNAKRGGHGESKNKIGSRGHDKVIAHLLASFLDSVIVFFFLVLIWFTNKFLLGNSSTVGTVIHLVEGDIPSAVEKVKVSSEALDPWEIPDTLEFHESESDQQTTSPDRVKNGIYNASSQELSIGKSTKVKEATQVSSNGLLSKLSPLNIKPNLKDLDFCEEKDSSEWETLQTDDDMSEAESMEETEEKQPIKYNVAELTKPGQRIIVAHGGDGGLGNITTGRSQRISKLKKHGEEKINDLETEVSDDEQNPSVSIGLPGTEAVLLLELKSIADVGLVGMPNAGKSTLLGALSRARPIVGHYEFTTLRPNLGNLNYDDFSITVADIPGLIKGAHENRGLGHAFLRHIERTKVLAYVVDLAAGLEGRKGIPPWEQLRDLLLELEFYQKGLTDRPSLVVANKTDEEGTEEVYQELKRRVPLVPIFPVCAVLQEGVAELKDGLRMLVGGVESYKLNIDDIDAD